MICGSSVYSEVVKLCNRFLPCVTFCLGVIGGLNLFDCKECAFCVCAYTNHWPGN